MTKEQVLTYVDHTNLSPVATWSEIQTLCDDALTYHTASICIPPSYVKRAKEYLGERMRVCTVIGFPQGYSTTMTKVYETRDALANGADEIDMVINLGDLKDGAFDKVQNEIRTIKDVCGENILKVIIETCLLTDEEIEKMCHVVMNAGADFIKTSTGCSTGGANEHVVSILGRTIVPPTRIKASGGITNFDDAERYIELGATRLGTSRLVNIMKNQEGKTVY